MRRTEAPSFRCTSASLSFGSVSTCTRCAFAGDVGVSVSCFLHGSLTRRVAVHLHTTLCSTDAFLFHRDVAGVCNDVCESFSCSFGGDGDVESHGVTYDVGCLPFVEAGDLSLLRRTYRGNRRFGFDSQTLERRNQPTKAEEAKGEKENHGLSLHGGSRGRHPTHPWERKKDHERPNETRSSPAANPIHRC